VVFGRGLRARQGGSPRRRESLGNLDTDPLFVRHGTRTYPEDPNMVPAPEDGDAVWIAGDCHSQGGTFNMGVYGGTAGASL